MKSTLFVMLLIVFVIPGPGQAGAGWQGEEVTENGERVVRNPENAPDVVTIAPEELWRRGEEDDDIFFGMPIQILEDDEGNIYVLDAQVSEIIVFSPEGEHLRTIGGEGEGPGEFRGASDMFMRNDGVIGVVVVFPGKIIQLGTDGLPAADFLYPGDKVEGFQLIFKGRAAGDRIFVSGAVQTGGAGKIESDQENYLKALDYQGNEVAHFHSLTEKTQYGGMEFDEKTFNNFTHYWTAADDGRAAASLTFDDYRIHVWKADGTIDYIIDRPDYTPLKRTAEEKKRFQELFAGVTSWNPNSTFKASDTHRGVMRLEFHPDGGLWVVSGRGTWERGEGVFVSFDVYDRDGRFVKRVDFTGPGDPMDDGMFFTAGRFYRVTELFNAFMAKFAGAGSADAGDEEAEPLQIIAYDIEIPELGVNR